MSSLPVIDMADVARPATDYGNAGRVALNPHECAAIAGRSERWFSGVRVRPDFPPPIGRGKYGADLFDQSEFVAWLIRYARERSTRGLKPVAIFPRKLKTGVVHVTVQS